MSTKSELDWLLQHTQPIDIDSSFRGIFVSDLHLGVRDEADDFKKNESLFLREMWGYKQRGFIIFGLGDVIDLWENPKLKDVLFQYPWLPDIFDYQTKGNHDGELDYPEAILLRYIDSGKKILCVHGHQGDFFNDDGSWIGRFFTRHIWRNLQMIGLKDPTTATPRNPKKHEATKKAIHEWSDEREQIIIFGHTHLIEAHPPYYFNTGSWVGDGGSAIEIIGGNIGAKIF